MTSNLVLNVFILAACFLCIVRIMLFSRKLLHRRKVRKWIARSDTNIQEIPLYPEQPLYSLLKPATLIRKVTWKGHFFFFAIWFSVLVVVILFDALFLPIKNSHSSEALFAYVLLIGVFAAFMIIAHILIAVVSYQRIEVDENELRVQTGLIRRRISWERSRLFAVDCIYGINGSASYLYELSDGPYVVRWEYSAKASLRKLITFSPVEYAQEITCLPGYICAQTNLPLRDLRPLLLE